MLDFCHGICYNTGIFKRKEKTMLLHICTNYFEKSEMLEVIKAGSENTAPRDVWLSKDSTGFVIVDNRDGNAWTEHFDKLLDAKHTEKFFKKRFNDNYRHPVYSTFNTYIAVDDKCDFLKDTTWFNCAPYTAVGKTHDSVLLKSFSSEPSYSPEGKNLLQTLLVQYEDDFDKWARLYEGNREAYKQEKEKIAQSVLAAIEDKFPQLKGKMTVVETVSPYSYYRFCGAYKGAYMSFILTPFAKKKTHKGTLRKIKNVFLAGQWLQPPGGLPNAGATGRFVIQRICKKEKVVFDNKV
jgi:phytoene dehydrogenase-like protein